MHTARKWVIGVGAATLLAVGIVFPALDIFGVFSLSTAILGSIVTPLNPAGLAALSGAFLIVPLLLITLFAYYLVPQTHFYIQVLVKVDSNWKKNVERLETHNNGKICRILFENKTRNRSYTHKRDAFTDDEGKLDVDKIETMNLGTEANSMQITVEFPMQPGIILKRKAYSIFLSDVQACVDSDPNPPIKATLETLRTILNKFKTRISNLEDYRYRLTSLAGTPIPLPIDNNKVTGCLSDIMNPALLEKDAPLSHIRGGHQVATLCIDPPSTSLQG